MRCIRRRTHATDVNRSSNLRGREHELLLGAKINHPRTFMDMQGPSPSFECMKWQGRVGEGKRTGPVATGRQALIHARRQAARPSGPSCHARTRDDAQLSNLLAPSLALTAFVQKDSAQASFIDRAHGSG